MASILLFVIKLAIVFVLSKPYLIVVLADVLSSTQTAKTIRYK